MRRKRGERMRAESNRSPFRRSTLGFTLCALTAVATIGCGGAIKGGADGGDHSDGGVGGGGGAGGGGGGAGGGGSGAGGGGTMTGGDDGGTSGGDDGGTTVSTTRVVAYLPTYSGSYSDWASSIDFSKMTHLNLAFVSGTSNNDWSIEQSAAEVKALVDAAHAKGVKVLASLGGGGGDQSVIAQFKNTGNIPAFVGNLDTFVASHNLDGVDIDIEDGANLGANYSAFVDAVVKKLRPEHKLVTAAVAQYLQDSMSDDTLHQFDFLNVMIYSNYNDSVSAMTYYAQQKNVPVTLLTLGAGFFGDNSDGSQEFAYSDIIKADGSAWSKDSTTVNGQTVNYTGMASMKKLADYSKGFGGIMFWELSEDTTDEHSLWKVIQGEM
jgi:chitinase